MKAFNFKGLSLRDKIILITAVSTTVSLLLACLVLAFNERMSYPKIMAGHLSELAQVIGDNSTAALSFNDAKTAQTLLETLKGNPHILSAALYDASGKVFAAYAADDAAALPASEASAQTAGWAISHGSLTLYQDVTLAGQKVGGVRLRSDLKEMSERMRAYSLVTLAVLALSVLVSFLTSARLQRQVSDPLRTVMEGLDDSAQQMTSSSSQISTASQQLAEGASESASSLEETSSSLEEMASMTRQNAESAGRAKKLMEETQSTVARGNQCVSETLDAMREMNESAQKVSKILKTIEEIAFQTNLLSLNAAVEAARAGEQGRGFAVVAEEVRSLAQRSSAAAKDTAALIEENARRAAQGLKVSDEAGRALGQIVDQSKKVSGLIEEIAVASEEQSRGIQEINGAVAQMDKVTQRNSANSEELSSFSEEMSAQSKGLREMVGGLLQVLNGAVKSAPAPAAAGFVPAPTVSQAPKAPSRSKGKAAFRAPERVVALSAEELRNF
jgi:methyl-accepting chemotaxis protein